MIAIHFSIVFVYGFHQNIGVLDLGGGAMFPVVWIMFLSLLFAVLVAANVGSCVVRWRSRMGNALFVYVARWPWYTRHCIFMN